MAYQMRLSNQEIANAAQILHRALSDARRHIDIPGVKITNAAIVTEAKDSFIGITLDGQMWKSKDASFRMKVEIIDDLTRQSVYDSLQRWISRIK
jgi:hypothetical protein